MSLTDTMVYDRTQADVDALLAILNKVYMSGYSALSADEITALSDADNKGAYNVNDVKRVIGAYLELEPQLLAQSIAVTIDPTLTTSTFNANKWMTTAQAAIYLANVEAIRNALTVYDDTPTTPNSMENLDFNMANDIERILFDVSQLLDNMISAYYFSGELYSGEV